MDSEGCQLQPGQETRIDTDWGTRINECFLSVVSCQLSVKSVSFLTTDING